MHKYITIAFLCLLQTSFLSAESEASFIFRVDWGSNELGKVFDQDVVVFSIDDLSIVRPTTRDHEKILYTYFRKKEQLYWSLVGGISGYFDAKSITCYGPIPRSDGSILNIRSVLTSRAYVQISDNLLGCKYEFYKINNEIIDCFFYCNSQMAECDPLGPGDYLVVASEIQKNEPLEVRSFSITQKQIDMVNKNFRPVKGSPERFCGVIKLDLKQLEQADPKLRNQLNERIPRTSVLSAALNCYYSRLRPLPQFSFEYEEFLEFKDPLAEGEK